MKPTRLSTHNKNIVLLVLLIATSFALLVAAFAPVRPKALSSPMANSASESSSTSSKALTTEQAREAYGKIEMSFEANRGQTDASVNFLARGAGYTLFLKPTEAVLQLRSADSGLRNDQNSGGSESLEQPAPDKKLPDNQHSEFRNPQSRVLRMKLVGADTGATAEGANELAGKVNYFTGNDASKWRAEIPTFARVRYSEVYPGVDLVYYGNQKQLEYDFVIAPGRDPQTVRLQFDGADQVEVDAAGDLLLSVGESVIRQPKPVVYQEVAGARHTIAGAYVVGADGQVGFAVGEYDAGRELIIDPVLVYSTYLGGSGDDEVRDIKVDSAGSAYICGETTSTNFPTVNPIDGTFAPGTFSGAADAFVTKINAAGTALVYSTYLGGNGGGASNGDDICFAIAIDAAGNAYLGGETHSSDFPTANAFQGTYGGGFSDIFVTKLNAAGSGLVYSTFIGGTIFDAGAGIAIDSSNNVYLTGRTTSEDFPVVNPIQATFGGTPGADAFVTKLNAAGTALVYSTYLGGNPSSGFENGSSIAVDSTGAAYVTGQVNSDNFPLVNAIQGTYGGGPLSGDAFVTKVNAAGSAFVFSTYLGGSGDDVGQDIAVDAAGNAHVAGFTASTNFPVANAFQNTSGGGTNDGFITKFNATGTAYVYSTYFGGSGGDSCNDIAVDSTSNVYVVGGTSSTNLPVVNPTQNAINGTSDAFYAKMNAAGTALVYSSYLGGSAFDRGNANTLDSAGNLYVAGITDSINFPTTNPAQATNGGADDTFITKISEAAATATYQFSQATHPVFEDVTFVTVTVTRSGDTSAAGTVDYGTADGTATERADYTTALGTLRFAAGDTSKTFDVLVNEDSKVEGNEAFTVALTNPTGGASLGVQATTTIQIMDDVTEPTTNVIDDAGIFVGTHYHDFLNRQADAGGQAFWTGQITSCGSDAACIDVRRTSVSTAFFVSIEFQQTGYLVFRFYKETFTDSVGRPRGMPRYREFLRDTQEIGRGVVVGVGNWETQLETNKQDFAQRWVQKAEFIAEFPAGMTAAQFVDKLFLNSEVTTPTTAERNAAIAAFGAGDVAGRAAALRNVADSGSVYNRQYNQAFVLIQYIGYLRRNPNDTPDTNYAGFDFWLNKMNQFSIAGEDVRTESVALGRIKRAEMVRAFIVSLEYRGRFGPL